MLELSWCIDERRVCVCVPQLLVLPAPNVMFGAVQRTALLVTSVPTTVVAPKRHLQCGTQAKGACQRWSARQCVNEEQGGRRVRTR